MKRNIWLLLLIPLIPLLTWAQGYWALYGLKDQLSAGCLNCSLTADLLPVGCVIIIPVVIVIWLFNRLNVKPGTVAICSALLLIAVWLWLDSSIFNERLAAWSSFTTAGVLVDTLSNAWLPILVGTLAWLAATVFLLRKETAQS